MFTFVIWVVGLCILGFFAMINFSIVAAAFEKHWFLGLLTIGASLIGWIILLVMIF